jgi:glycosyltransferase involved in cell wall biosynthesis
VTTSAVGATSNIVKQGVNGLIVPPQDVPALANALTSMLDDDALRERMGTASRRIIAGWNVELAAANFTKCVEQAVRHRRGRASRAAGVETP